MKKIIILLTIATACVVAAHADDALYKNDSESIKATAEKISKNEKEISGNKLLAMTNSAFEIYWNQPEIQTQFRTYTKDDLEQAVRNLKERGVQLKHENDSLMTVLDSINIKIKVLENREADINKRFTDEYEQLYADKQAVVEERGKAEAEAATLGTEIAQLDSAHTAKLGEILRLQKQLDDLLGQNATQNQLLENLNDQKGKVLGTVALIDRMLEAAQKASLDNINTGSLKDAIDSYYTDQQLIATMLSKTEAAKAQESILKLEDYVAICNAYKEAVAITGGAYDDAKALMVKNTLNQKKAELTPTQAKEISNIIKTLEQQKTDTEKFIALADRVGNEGPFVAAKYREDNHKYFFETEPAEKDATKLTIVAALKSPFAAIREAAEKLSAPLIEVRKDINNDWDSYINLIKKTVKK